MNTNFVHSHEQNSKQVKIVNKGREKSFYRIATAHINIYRRQLRFGLLQSIPFIDFLASDYKRSPFEQHDVDQFNCPLVCWLSMLVAWLQSQKWFDNQFVAGIHENFLKNVPWKSLSMMFFESKNKNHLWVSSQIDFHLHRDNYNTCNSLAGSHYNGCEIVMISTLDYRPKYISTSAFVEIFFGM